VLDLQKHKILIVQEDKAVSSLISAALDTAGCQHAVCPCDSSAFFQLQTDHFDLILMDIEDGNPTRLAMLNKLGAVEIPLICLVNRTAGTVPVPGFQYGAEDILLKPFTVADLLGRIEIVMSRTTHTTHKLSFHDIEINLPERQVAQAGRSVQLTPKEFDLLVLLVEHTDVALSRARILQAVWGYCITCETRTVDMHIMQLRKKLDFRQKLKSVIKVGYRLDR
jgi:DNA-binding response OmpR family regulator